MARNGRDLERLVAFIEEHVAPQGFKVTRNEREFDKDGVPIAEFDVVVRGSFGTTKMTWLIQCRDRPSDGKAPHSWIMELVGRRCIFHFDKVTAVSTTGFARGAIDTAMKEGIELREVKALEPEEFKSWLKAEYVTVPDYLCQIVNFELIFLKENHRRKHIRSGRLIASNQMLFRPWGVNNDVSLDQILQAVVREHPSLVEGLKPNSTAKRRILISPEPPGGSGYIMKTPEGPFRLRKIRILADVSLLEERVPFNVSAYRRTEDDEAISEFATASCERDGKRYTIELHRVDGVIQPVSRTEKIS